MIDWQKTPLIPVVAQDSQSHEVLMLAYANRDAYELSLQTGFAHYFSRSKNRLWKKGETSGHTQKIVRVLVDCDADSLLYIVEQNGAACHTGHRSCFFTDAVTQRAAGERVADPATFYAVVDRLYETILERKNGDSATSYVASLFSKGENALLKKVVEEAGEFCFALKDGERNQIVYEAADLLFHALVALGFAGVSPDLVRAELARREGVSGITEKALRKP
ncbi:histidine biosynthesis bifunctional protein HisIE [Campylobacterota bacterium]|nr:histidine biosynthesis bifunctional protein HisIE [Campylobacterota bacterium]